MAALSGTVFLNQQLRWHEWVAIVAVMAASIGATAGPPDVTPVEVLG
jgi:threonine/homoserine efflux transporter RhtA